MVETEQTVGPMIVEDTTIVRAFGAFDHDDPIDQVTMRGLQVNKGTCCYTTGEDDHTVCARLTKGRCDTLEGEFIRDKKCSDNPCRGACCYDDNTCEDLSESDCSDAGGDFKGIDTACDDDPNPCIGACCYSSDGSCFVQTQRACEDDCEGGCEAGVFQGTGTDCDPNPCSVACGTLVCAQAARAVRWCGYACQGTMYHDTNLAQNCNGSGDKIAGDCDEFRHDESFTASETRDISNHVENLDIVTCSVTGEDTSSSDYELTGDTPVSCSGDLHCWFDHYASMNSYCASGMEDSLTYIACPPTEGHEFWTSSGPAYTDPECGTCTSSTTCFEDFSFSNEYSLAAFLAYVEPYLTYGDFGDTLCGASSTDFTGNIDQQFGVISRYRYKFTFGTPTTADLTISWNENGSPMSEFLAAGATESSVYQGPDDTDSGDITDIFCTLAE